MAKIAITLLFRKWLMGNGSMKKCLITGASGFLGQAVMARLKKDYDVVGLANRSPGPQLVQVDLRDAAAVRKVLASVVPDLVVHLAAYKEPDFCEEHPEEARRLNTESVRTLREALPDSTRLVAASTDYVFDGRNPPYAETDQRSPVSVYGQTKCDAEDVLQGRPNTVIIRFPVLVGAGKDLKSSGFITQILESFDAKTEQVLDDVIVRFPIWIRDIAEAIAFLESKSATGTFHLSGPRGATRYAWTREIGEVLGRPTGHLKPSKTIVPRRAERPVNSQLSTNKIHALGYPSFTDFVQVVREVLRAMSDDSSRKRRE